MILYKPTDLIKAKYLRRWRGAKGDWEYAYYNKKGREPAKEKPTGAHRGTLKGVATEREIKELTKHFARRPKGMGKEKTIQTKRDLDIILKHTTFALMSAGRNPNNEEDMKLDDAAIKARHGKLLSRLKEEGYVYSTCRGKYEHPEESVMVMMHDSDRESAMAIGEAFNQDSIVLCSKGKNELIFTTGEKKGQATMAGSGYEEVPDANNYYTKIPLSTGGTIKFSMALEDIKKALRELVRMFEKSSRMLFMKSKKMPIGTVSHGRKKIAEGDWREVPTGRKKMTVGTGHGKGQSEDTHRSKMIATYSAAKLFNENKTRKALTGIYGSEFAESVISGVMKERGGVRLRLTDKEKMTRDVKRKVRKETKQIEDNNRSTGDKMRDAIPKGPKASADERKRMSKGVSSAVNQSYYSSIPVQDIDNALRKEGFLLVQEDGTPWSGMLLGNDSRTIMQVGRIGDFVEKDGVKMHTILSNVGVALSWYKDDKRRDSKYDVVAYLS